MSCRALKPLLRVQSALGRIHPVPRAFLSFRPAVFLTLPRTFASTPPFFGSGTCMSSSQNSISSQLVADGTLSSALTAEHTYELEAAKEGPEVPEFLDRFTNEKSGRCRIFLGWTMLRSQGVSEMRREMSSIFDAHSSRLNS